jgi:hypothetical protein
LARLEAINADPELQALTLAVAKQDIVTWALDWCFTYDPREEQSDRPFDLFPRQIEFLAWLKQLETDQKSGVAEKCRDVGFTWLCATYAVHGWLFRPGFSCGIGSRKEKLVDEIGNADSIFEKLRFLLRWLPGWMLPVGFNWKKDDNFCKLVNPENGATLTGEAGDNIGRGGRKSIYFVDEAAFLERSQKVVAALSQNSRCKVWVSTPNGTGNEFYRMRFSGKFPVFTFNWRDDPRKDDAWYEEQKEILPPAILAQEVDIDYTASLEGILIEAKWVRAAVEFQKWLRDVEGLELPTSGDKLGGLDIAEGGADKSVLTIKTGCVVADIESWEKLSTTQTAFKARDLCLKHEIKHLLYDAGGGYGATVKGMMEQAADAHEDADVSLSEEIAGELAELRKAFENLPYGATGVNGGATPDELTKWPDGRTSKEMFANLRAELWWKMRLAFERTFEYRTGIKKHPLELLISIPNHSQLIAELSTPLYWTTETGKILLEPKKAMKLRSVASPDFGDSLAYTNAKPKKKRTTQVW